MPTKLEYTIQNIGRAALNYVNGERVRKIRSSEYKDLDYVDFLSIKDPAEIQAFIDGAVKEACMDKRAKPEDWAAHKACTDTTGRREHLEYLFAVYKFAISELNESKTLDSKRWDKLTVEVSKCLKVCEVLMHRDITVDFEGHEYVLSSLHYQTFSISGGIGNLGHKLQEILFDGKLDDPKVKGFDVQVLDMVSEMRNQILREQLPTICQNLESNMRQVAQLTEIVQQLVAGRAEDKAAHQQLEAKVDGLMGELQILKDERARQTMARSRFGLLARPATTQAGEKTTVETADAQTTVVEAELVAADGMKVEAAISPAAF